MIEDEILQGFLEKSAARAMDEIKQDGKLSEANAIPLLLKAQFNHVAHLDLEQTTMRKDIGLELADIRKTMATFVTKAEFNEFKSEINSKLNWAMGALTLLICIVLPIILRFV